MELGWLDFVIQGGALVLLAIVLWGVWRIVQRLMDMMKAQIEYIQASIKVQAQVSATLSQLCEKIDDHERRAETRHQRIMNGQRKE